MVEMNHDETRQIGPRVPAVTADALEFTVRRDNDGKYRGRMAERVQRDLRLGIGRWALAHPEGVEELRESGREEVADELEECAEMWRRVVDASSGSCDCDELREEVSSLRGSIEELADVSYGNFRMLSRRERTRETSDRSETEDKGTPIMVNQD